MRPGAMVDGAAEPRPRRGGGFRCRGPLVSAPDPQLGRRRASGRSIRGVQARIARGAEEAPFPQSAVLRDRAARGLCSLGTPAWSAVRSASAGAYSGVQKVKCRPRSGYSR